MMTRSGLVVERVTSHTPTVIVKSKGKLPLSIAGGRQGT
jgi:hypothetical protein